MKSAGDVRGGRGLPIESRYVVPHFVERTSSGTREFDPYGKLFEERVIFLGSQVDDTSANDIMAQMLCLESMDPDRDISLYINSPGGSFTALTAIYDTMMFVKPDVQTVCLGQANSAAAVILAAGAPGKRLALPSARVLIHQPSSQGSQGQVSDLEIQAAEIERLSRLMERMLAEHCGQDVEKVAADVERDKIFTAEEAKAYGLVDQVISPRTIAGAGVV
ncbi:ATP-dependent Clp protease proteolytic subunit [Streptomyces sp. MZ04]|uniref:ATP-dependent Clp protease proteolytic subunit n=1 Tax=Streptomyces sp. MZ04 TaxID=2559236 RepID=UPI00107ECFD9|nr:ATP-dependent Clp protease proteolytic subunit [Streptomyces sp. MZ04]TGB14808.1 ATP-dependent Clp protease proteolytic subunit [Streptomyces sp. MZ04]